MDPVVAWMIAAGPWLYLGVFTLVVADAFTVVLPSETVVVALASLALSTGTPALAALIPVATLGAIVGDNLCYALGRRLGVDRWRWLTRPRPARALEYARRTLDERPASVILTARYVPFARIAVNLTAGATRFAYRRYLPLTLVAGLGWAVYNSVIGAVFGAWLSAHPVLGVVASVVVAVAVGVTIDALVDRIARRRARRAPVTEPRNYPPG